jgi:signal peptidase II
MASGARAVSARRLGFLCAVLVFAIDQSFAAWMLYGFGIADRGPLAIAPFVDLRLAWNTGISYSLFRADGQAGRWVLTGLALVASLVLGVWLTRTDKKIAGAGLGLIIGGALGNGCDRLSYGAVADFFHIRIAGFSPFGVFNLADMAIVAGVGLLLYDGLWGDARKTGERRAAG